MNETEETLSEYRHADEEDYCPIDEGSLELA
jgi:hypothetical protein